MFKKCTKQHLNRIIISSSYYDERIDVKYRDDKNIITHSTRRDKLLNRL